MLNEMTYKEKFVLLQEWLPSIIADVKKDLRREHLQQDPVFSKKYFSNKTLNKLTSEELVHAYRTAVAEEEKGEDIAEFICNRWLMKHSEIYQAFEDYLRPIHPNFTELTELDAATSNGLMDQSIRAFGALNTYLFSIINSVVFPQTIYDQLKQRAKEESIQQASQAKDHEEQTFSANKEKSYQEQIARLTDKYEKKLQGLQTKYTQDVESLKKQIANLQRKLHAQQ